MIMIIIIIITPRGSFRSHDNPDISLMSALGIHFVISIEAPSTLHYSPWYPSYEQCSGSAAALLLKSEVT
jgi:hypothetical protein